MISGMWTHGRGQSVIPPASSKFQPFETFSSCQKYVLPKIQNFGLKSAPPPIWKTRTKLQFGAPHLFSRKFAAICRKIASSCPSSTFLTTGAAGNDDDDNDTYCKWPLCHRLVSCRRLRCVAPSCESVCRPVLCCRSTRPHKLSVNYWTPSCWLHRSHSTTSARIHGVVSLSRRPSDLPGCPATPCRIYSENLCSP